MVCSATVALPPMRGHDACFAQVAFLLFLNEILAGWPALDRSELGALASATAP